VQHIKKYENTYYNKKNSRIKKNSKMFFTHKIDFYSKIKNYLKKVLAHIIEYLIKNSVLHKLNYVKKWYGR